MTTTRTFATIRTAQYSDAAAADTERRLAYRQEDLNGYGRHGYALLSTIVVPTAEGVVIVDTLALDEER